MAESVVAIARGENRFALVEEAARLAGFWENIEAALAKSGKPREQFLIAIKVNLMIFMSPQVPVTATDPALVEHLVKMLREHGFRDIKVVESQNTMSNWLRNRTVANVARVAGYTGQGYDIVDLTIEKMPHVYKVRGLGDWKNYVGRTWRDADYRIDFAKFKTQFDNNFTLCLKNEFGTLPLANKYRHYHTLIPYWAATLYTLVNFPVHFGFVDAYTASDGMAGFALQYEPKMLKRVLAGSDIVAVDQVGADLMGVDTWEAPVARFAMQFLGEPTFKVVGDTAPLEVWENVPEEIHNLIDVAQAVYMLANPGAELGIIQVDTKEFPPRIGILRWYYKVLNTLLLFVNGKLFSPHDHRLVTTRLHEEAQRGARREAHSSMHAVT
jgi:uncharacterized protein (DUF362 family)